MMMNSNSSSERISSSVPHERYEIVAKIGAGGYGSVFKAWDSQLRQYVAIKLINLEDNGFDLEEEVNQEISMMANVFCDQLVKYYTSFIVDSNLWIVMEYLEGGSLSEVMKFGGHPLSENSISFVMRELLKVKVLHFL
jgi:serine/threonine-protein kinase 24/25/MST4